MAQAEFGCVVPPNISNELSAWLAFLPKPTKILAQLLRASPDGDFLGTKMSNEELALGASPL